jgi:hypothetical protein
LKLDEALRQYLPPPKKPLALRVTFVGGQDDAPPGAAAVDGVQKCRHCGFEPKDHERWPRCPHCGWKTGADMLTMQWREPAMACAAPSPSPENAPAGSPRTANVIPLDAEQRAAELRAAARKDRDGYAPPPQQARVNYNNAGTNNESISAFMRRIEDSYR